MESTIKKLEFQFNKFENRAKAVQMEAYMKNLFPFYGIAAPKRNEILRPIWKTDKTTILHNWREIIDQLWDKDQREYQMVALELLKKIYKKLEATDLDYLMRLVQRKSWWDTVDLLASTPIGYILSKDKSLQSDKVKGWIEDSDIWVQRVALIHQLKYKKKVDLDLLFYCVTKVKNSSEFFLRKGSGWGLREASKVYPQEVANFIKDNGDLSGLTKREASKYLKDYL